METWGQKLQSRKFLLCLGAIAALLVSYGTSQIDSTAFITGLIAAIGTYQASEAAVDAARAKAV